MILAGDHVGIADSLQRRKTTFTTNALPRCKMPQPRKLAKRRRRSVWTTLSVTGWKSLERRPHLHLHDPSPERYS